MSPAGRPKLAPDGLLRTSLRISTLDLDYLRDRGDGNASAGLRTVIAEARRRRRRKARATGA